MKTKNYNFIFGPVPSRRLGHSLGIDVIPFKTCSYDCIYCQLGRTTNKTIIRKEYIPLKEILRELDLKFKEGIIIDYITLSGSGEPTLYSRIDELISEIKERTDIPVAVLTNGSLLWDSKIQDDLMNADLVIPSLDAGDEYLFNYVNRPHGELSFTRVVNGIIDFASMFSNEIWLEVFLLGGVTAVESETKKIASFTKTINPDKIQLNTVVRPSAESFAYPVSKEHMINLKKNFNNENIEIISDFNKISETTDFEVSKVKIFNLLKRRPCSLSDIVNGLQVHRNEAIKYLDQLTKEGKVDIDTNEKGSYYIISRL